MARCSDDLRSAISELAQDIAAAMDEASRVDKIARAQVTLDMLDVRYRELSKELNQLIANSSSEAVMAEAMEYMPTF